eukprot:232154-Pleurochrysis_carterae.AAC.1
MKRPGRRRTRRMHPQVRRKYTGAMQKMHTSLHPTSLQTPCLPQMTSVSADVRRALLRAAPM